MTRYIYLRRGGIVEHISETPNEEMTGVESVIEVSDDAVDVGILYVYNYDDDTFSSPEEKKGRSIDVPGFFLLFKSDERLKARELRATDPIIDDFWTILEDPRTVVVNMSIQQVQDAIGYILTKVEENGVVLDVQARLAEILSGTAPS